MDALQDLEKSIVRRSEALDDKLLTLATGALALSVTFSDSLIGNDPNILWMLGITWGLLTVCVVAHLVGALLAIYHSGMFLGFMRAADEDHVEVTEDIISNEFQKESKRMLLIFKINILSFMGGIVAFSIFAVANLSP